MASAASGVKRFFRKDFDSLDPYVPVTSLEVLAEEIGVKVADLVKLDANENLYGPIPEIQEAIASCDVYHIYPDPGQVHLRKDIATFLATAGVTADHVCGGCGSDEILDLVLRLFDPKAVINLPPTFAMYPFLAKISRVPILNIDRLPAPGFAIDFAAVEKAAKEGGANLIFCASPNNPTGGMLTHAEVARLCALDAIVVIDEAYAEFAAPGASAVSLIPKHDNLIVLRTFSKWAGLAGVRVGYSVAHPTINAALMGIKQPYNVNVAGDTAARAALKHAPKIFSTQVQPILKERDVIIREVRALGWLNPLPTDSNFVLCEVAPPFVASEIVAALRKRAVLVRYYPRGRLAGCIRISAGRPTDTTRLLAALHEIAAEQEAKHGKPLVVPTRPSAVLFDMDGVLVEVAGSYREAIVQTAAHFGVAVTHADIDAIKAAGGANNDWIVTQRLIEKALAPAGSSSGGGAAATATVPSLAEVTAVFERLYQGDPAAATVTGRAGLKATESALLTRDQLLEVKARCPGGIAVVTGRPRADAAEAIARYGWDGVFDAVVCMEDAPLKPDPAPVKLALEKLAALRAAEASAASTSAAAPVLPAIMIGDTVDDIRAAVSAGVAGIGVFPPDKAPSAAPAKAAALQANLTAAGAFAVWAPGCHELLALLPKRESADAIRAANGKTVAAFIAGTAAPAAGAASAATGGAGTAKPAAAAAPADGTIGTGVGRTGSCKRTTKETDIYAWVNLDGVGVSRISTGLGFLDHMLSAFTKHGHIDAVVTCKGDLWIDDHHTAEDVALALGEAVDKALGARKDIRRWGSALCPLDEALARAVIDISSRPHAEISLDLHREKVGELSTEMIPHVFESFAATARITLHVDVLKGKNDHHKAEASFKALGVALREAISSDAGGIPSTKGVLA